MAEEAITKEYEVVLWVVVQAEGDMGFLLQVLYYLHKLNHLNVTVGHLEETGVGKTVNALRHQGGKVGEKARGLVNKWKAMVTAEEEEEEEEEAGENEEEPQPKVEAAAPSRVSEANDLPPPSGGEQCRRRGQCPVEVLCRGLASALDCCCCHTGGQGGSRAGSAAKEVQDDLEDEEEEDEEDCLQIEENNNPAAEDNDGHGSDHSLEEEPQPATSVPRSSYGYSQDGSSDSGAEDAGDYNPLTSRRDYQVNTGMPVTEYHPSAMSQSPRTSSPESGGDSPGGGRDWKNGTSARSPQKKGSREEKERSREREKHGSREREKHGSREREKHGSREREKYGSREREKYGSREREKHGSREREKHSSREREKHGSKGKRKHRDSSSSHERDRKRDKHRDKHRNKEEERTEDTEDEKRSKSHKDKHRDREKHQARPRESKHRVDDSSERDPCKYDRESDASVVNGFNTPEHRDRSSSSKRESRERERSVGERQKEKVDEGHYQSGESAHQNRLAERTKLEKESGKEKHRDGSKKDKHKREHREKEESPERPKKDKKSKPFAVEEEGCSAASNSVNKDNRGGERTGKGKQKDNKHKQKDSSKKDKHKRESPDKQEVEQHHSAGERNKKEKKAKQQTPMDSGFGAVLMGLDTQAKKKKKKKRKEGDKERDSGSDEEQPSTSGGTRKAHTGDGGLPATKKPKLLSGSVDRLPRLPPVMVPDNKPLLPEITPNYKPLPRMPVRDGAPEPCFSKMTEEEALNFVFQSKSNKRSKVYSGKVCGLSFVPSLYDSCIRVLQENIDALEFTGGIPFEILRPVLDRATPKQLLNLEDYNHYLLEDSDVLWEVHCRKDFKHGVRIGCCRGLITQRWLGSSWRECLGRNELEGMVGEEHKGENGWGRA
ncbi:Transcription elongation factor B polypeptide 3 [Chionoecetes opilio]|uniref:Transcription elongation factor B polypeptide 3 n=1 Tax=Chionoecetes opilio TaxID=41210 RepID=A0A8J4YJQ4_CHIOP|nr:Transcription elongation factor B polypeptide 3 [Chionoecetes opilio]